MRSLRAGASARGRAALARLLRRPVEEALADRAGPLAPLAAGIREAAARVEDLERRLEVLHERDPFSPRSTVARALAAHPGTASVLASLHLPACPTCPVREDETLEELAASHGLSLQDLVHRLRSLPA